MMVNSVDFDQWAKFKVLVKFSLKLLTFRPEESWTKVVDSNSFSFVLGYVPLKLIQ